MTPRLMSPRDTCRYLGICQSTLRLWVQSGRIPGPIDGTTRYDREAIDRALDRQSGIVRESGPETAFDEWIRTRQAAE